MREKFYAELSRRLRKEGIESSYGNDLNGRDLRDYESCIHETMLENQLPEEKERGLMRW